LPLKIALSGSSSKDFLYYQYSADEMICGLYWESRWFCIITALYIPITSACTIIYTNFKRAITHKKVIVVITLEGVNRHLDFNGRTMAKYLSMLMSERLHIEIVTDVP
jgi:hypothetical protein